MSNDQRDPENAFQGFHIRTEQRNQDVLSKIEIVRQVREVIDEILATTATMNELEQVEQIVGQAVALLKAKTHSHEYQGPAEGSMALPANSFLDRSPIMGAINALAIPMVMSIEGDGSKDSTVVGKVTFSSAYEGPPGCVHGGFIAAYFDEVLGMAQSLSGNPGMTVNLTIDYRSPTPLLQPLIFRGQIISINGRKIGVSGTLHHGETLCAEASGLFVSMRREVFDRLLQIRGQ